MGRRRFRGVSWSKRGWTARLTVRRRHYHLGTYSDELSAARAYDRAALALLGGDAPRNFPDDPALTPATPLELAEEKRGLNQKSRYRGVCAKRETWTAAVKKEGKTFRLGGFQSEVDAARAYDRLALHYVGAGAKLNFPTRSSRPATIEELRREVFAAQMRRRRETAPPRAEATKSYRGVRWRVQTASWQARITLDGSEKHIGFFPSARAAARAYDRVAKAEYGERALLNFPNNAKLIPRSFAEARAERQAARKARMKSRYRGVSWMPDENKWKACVVLHGVQHSASGFLEEEDAARARDRIAVAVLGPKASLNFPDEMPAAVAPAQLRRKLRAVYKETTSSKYRGVCWSEAKQRWIVRIQEDYRQHSLGRFHDEVKAARAYDRAARRLHGDAAILNFPVGGHQDRR